MYFSMSAKLQSVHRPVKSVLQRRSARATRTICGGASDDDINILRSYTGNSFDELSGISFPYFPAATIFLFYVCGFLSLYFFVLTFCVFSSAVDFISFFISSSLRVRLFGFRLFLASSFI